MAAADSASGDSALPCLAHLLGAPSVQHGHCGSTAVRVRYGHAPMPRAAHTPAHRRLALAGCTGWLAPTDRSIGRSSPEPAYRLRLTDLPIAVPHELRAGVRLVLASGRSIGHSPPRSTSGTQMTDPSVTGASAAVQRRNLSPIRGPVALRDALRRSMRWALARAVAWRGFPGRVSGDRPAIRGLAPAPGRAAPMHRSKAGPTGGRGRAPPMHRSTVGRSSPSRPPSTLSAEGWIAHPRPERTPGPRFTP